jgi:hypothetical protein
VLPWEEIAESLWDFSCNMRHYPGPKIIVISACGASNQKLTGYFQQKAKNDGTTRPPAYVITTVGNDEGEVAWSDSVAAWTIFYHQIGKAVLARTDIQLILDKIQIVGAGKLKYFRWDGIKKMYFNYVSSAKEHTKQTGAFKAGTATAKPKPRAK